jgi:hypothetical protein
MLLTLDGSTNLSVVMIAQRFNVVALVSVVVFDGDQGGTQPVEITKNRAGMDDGNCSVRRNGGWLFFVMFAQLAPLDCHFPIVLRDWTVGGRRGRSNNVGAAVR